MTASKFPLSMFADVSLEALTAATYARGRACIPLLQRDVIPSLPPLQRYTPERVINHIEMRNLLDERTATDVEVLLDQIARLVAQGTVQVTRWSDELEGHVGEARAFTETRRTPQAARLAAAASELETLHTMMMAALDLAHAQAVVAQLWQRH